jgi:L-threonylcarbamoyladenylate synthase
MSKVIIFPTDTVYGIGTPIFDLDGIDRIYRIKNRSKDKPLACLCSCLKQIEDISYVDNNAKKLINKFLPGGLTIILKAKKEIVDRIGYETIGIRIPNHALALEILNENGPMLTTSVNDSGYTPLNEYDEIVSKYSNLVECIYNSKQPSSNISSTVVRIVDGKVSILREGIISKEEIEKEINNV